VMVGARSGILELLPERRVVLECSGTID
jgi:hypothetical protein